MQCKDKIKNPTAQEILSKKARRKFCSTILADNLAISNTKSPLHQSYIRSIFCCHSLEICPKEGYLKSSGYCKNRWCLTCNRIRTAKLTEDYAAAVDNMEEPYFITLTRPTITKRQLTPRVQEMLQSCRTINQYFTKLLRKKVHQCTTKKQIIKAKNAGTVGIPYKKRVLPTPTFDTFDGLRKIECTTRPGGNVPSPPPYTNRRQKSSAGVCKEMVGNAP